ncbi:MAG: Fe-S-containing protein [Nitrospirota bacterium]
MPLFLLLLQGCAKGRRITHEPIKEQNGIIKIDLKDIRKGAIHFYTFNSPKGKRIDFFVAKDSNGNINSAFDACAICYRKRLGYRKEDEYIVCNACGNKYEIADLDKGLGSCLPIPLKHSIEGEYLTIKTPEFLRGGYLF